jgi:hypothetical protein
MTQRLAATAVQAASGGFPFPNKNFGGKVIDPPPGVPAAGNAFASKGFWDESSGRYLHWTWIWEAFHNASGTPETIWGWEASPSIARELTVDLESQTLVFNPVSVQAPRLYNWFAINLKF